MCWQTYGRRWERQPERTLERRNTDDLRIADSDRERAIAQLSKHAGDGRLTLEEFEARVEEVYAAKTNVDLRPAFRDLPTYDPSPLPRTRSHMRSHIDVASIVRPLAMLALLVWAAIAWGPWVLWIGLWILLPRLFWSRGWQRRMHRGNYERRPGRSREEELTSVYLAPSPRRRGVHLG
jgi:hypothetical protein